ncbi:MAG TPA: nucleotidyl transferase AbiEii/AbiGii toxin family protein [Xanthobacteraceae bacterium]|nr:nucleotidyl transferase AbiEii/AbiGii toxin family protein [Xanthobacteraceae bacterium]
MARARPSTPNEKRTIRSFIADDLSNWLFDIDDITTIRPERTFWEKLLILHGAHCGYRDEQRLPSDRDRLSRHYYDVAMISATAVGRKALGDQKLATAVREHNLLAFRQAWKKFEEAVPGTLRLVPQEELRREIEKDYAAMQGMILGDAPPFEWIIEQLAAIEAAVNRT